MAPFSTSDNERADLMILNADCSLESHKAGQNAVCPGSSPRHPDFVDLGRVLGNGIY